MILVDLQSEKFGTPQPLDVLADTIQPFPTFSEIYLEPLKKLASA